MPRNTEPLEEKFNVIKAPFSYLIEKIKERNKKGYNNNIVITGPPGIGKSYTALSLALMLDKDFTIDKVIFDVESFLKRVKEIEGGCIVFDEGGVEIGHRAFQSVTNKAFTFVAQTFRFKRINLIITVPYFYWIDKVARILTNFLIKMVDRGLGYVYTLEYNPITGFRKIKGIEFVKIPDPRDIDPDLVEEYEEKKRKYFSNLIDNAQKELDYEKTKMEYFRKIMKAKLEGEKNEK